MIHFIQQFLKIPKKIKNVKQLENFQSNEFTYDECSITKITSNDNFSFTFHSIDQPKLPKKSRKHQVKKSTNSFQ